MAELDIDSIVREMARIRDEIPQAQTDERPSLLMQYERLGHLIEQAGKSNEDGGGVDSERPYFAHMELEENGKSRHVFLGNATRLDNGLRIVDWRHAPVSALFYRHAEGDEYEEQFAGRTKRGVVELRRTVTISDGKLTRVKSGEDILVRNGEDWRRMDADHSRLAGGQGAASRVPVERLGRVAKDQRLPEITALIDPQQFEAIRNFREKLKLGATPLVGIGIQLTDPTVTDALSDTSDFFWVDQSTRLCRRRC